MIRNVKESEYGHTVSTVFGSEEKRNGYASGDDDDPIMKNLRVLDYRYIRCCFHPVKDKFVLSSDWKDPAWTTTSSMKLGLDGDERTRREQVFDKNIIDIEVKSILQLLIDEVNLPEIYTDERPDLLGFASILRLPSRKPHPMVTGSVLLLCNLHLSDITGQHNEYAD